jgi:carotenoid 1,2-hydratase
MPTVKADNFTFSSSVKADVWHPQKDDKSYEWWYFDALSDDGREAIIVVFLDNFIYSPRYNRESLKITGNSRCPAVSFTYFRDGKAVYKATTEYHSSDFHGNESVPECRIGDSGFRMESADYGSGYFVTVEAQLGGGRTLKAELEWLSVEADLSEAAFCFDGSRHCWNMVAPRSDVSGRITVSGRRADELDSIHFRGTGYHDHNMDNRWLAKTVRDWHWGRAHFADCTAVFYRFRETGQPDANTRLILVTDGELQLRDVAFEEQSYVRDKLGIRYPAQLHLVAEDNVRLDVKPIGVIDSSFYFLRFLSEVTLSIPGKSVHATTGITEFIAPKTLKYRWLNWLADVQTGKNGESSYF